MNTPLPTPVRAESLAVLLKDYDPVLADTLVTGFRSGFDIGFRGSCAANKQVKNLVSSAAYPKAVNCHIDDELSKGRFCGPFSEPPFPFLHISPIGVVPKKSPGKFRMIVDLSSPRGNAVNEGIADERAAVSYSSLTDAIKIIIDCGPGAFMAKADIESAFRIIPVLPEQYPLLGFQWNNSLFYDRCLPMGCRSSCQIFELFSTSLQFILSRKGVYSAIHYLDDFLFVSPSEGGCKKYLCTFQDICKIINIPLSPEKMVDPTQVISFLGFEIDTIREEVRLPLDKLEKCRDWITWLLGRQKCTLRELQSLLGLLSFACAVVPGRAFLQNLYQLTTGVAKPHHFISISSETKKDLTMWLHFLQSFNGVTLYREQLFLSNEVLHIFTDACTSLGCGALLNNHWFSIPWPNQVFLVQNITLLELLPIVLAVDIWSSILSNKTVVIHTDNSAIQHCIENQSSKEKSVMALIRQLVLLTLQFTINLKAVHISGSSNVLADLLSRLQIQLFKEKFPAADQLPTPVPDLVEWMSFSLNQ